MQNWLREFLGEFRAMGEVAAIERVRPKDLDFCARAAAVLLAATLLLVWLWREPSLTLHAVVERAEYSQVVFPTRTYRVKISVAERGGVRTERHACEVTFGPGRRFLLTGDALFGGYRIGFDGEELWCLPPFEHDRWARPVQAGSELEDGVSNLGAGLVDRCDSVGQLGPQSHVGHADHRLS